MKKLYTNAFLVTEDKVLLGFKKRGFGVGLWNGYGGKVNPGESVYEAAVREVGEESGLKDLELEKGAVIRYFVDNDPTIEDEMHVYRIINHSGLALETEEMRPGWFPITGLPYDSMWKDGPHWWADFFRGQNLTGQFYYDTYEGGKLLRYNIEKAGETEL